MSKKCVRCKQPRSDHGLKGPGLWTNPCPRFEPKAPLWLRTLTWSMARLPGMGEPR